MNIKLLRKAIRRIKDARYVLSARQITYLRTYEPLIELAKRLRAQQYSTFLQVSAAAYGWMPRVLRVDLERLPDAARAFHVAGTRTSDRSDYRDIGPISVCLYSVVGASKVLHFRKPDVYPIWDRKVQRVWGKKEPAQSFMSDPANYVAYAQGVQALTQKSGFDHFYDEFCEAYVDRLGQHGIPSYEITRIRVVEAALFELSGGEYEDA